MFGKLNYFMYIFYLSPKKIVAPPPCFWLFSVTSKQEQLISKQQEPEDNADQKCKKTVSVLFRMGPQMWWDFATYSQ